MLGRTSSTVHPSRTNVHAPYSGPYSGQSFLRDI